MISKTGGRKANMVADGLTIIIILVVTSIVAIICYLALSEVNAEVQADTTLHNNTKTILANETTSYSRTWDSAMLLLLFGLWAITVIMAFLIDSHPVFFIISAVLMMFVIIVAANVSNAFEEITDDADLSVAAAGFPMTRFVMSKLPYVILGILVSVGLALYAKMRGAQ